MLFDNLTVLCRQIAYDSPIPENNHSVELFFNQINIIYSIVFKEINRLK